MVESLSSTQPIAAIEKSASQAGNGEGNGKSYWNPRKESRHDAALRFEGRCAAGDRVAGWAMRDYAAQDQHERWIRIGPDRPCRVRERKEADQGDARTLCQAQPASGEICARSWNRS